MTNETEVEVTIEPCPFCGGVDAFIERADFSSCYVVCNDCYAHGPTSCNENDEDVAAEEAGMEPGENAARRLWNTRASTTTDTALAEALMSAPYEWHGPFGKEKHRIIPPTLFDRILAVLEGKRT